MFDVRKFGAYISRLRKDANLTQGELAVKLGLDGLTVSKFENGELFPDAEIMNSLSAVFSVSLESLIGGGEPSSAETEFFMRAFSAHKDNASDNAKAEDMVGIAPLLKPDVLNKLAEKLSDEGIDISAVVSLAEYLNDENVLRLLENVDADTLNEELLEKLIPLLDQKSKAVIFEKILEGTMDYHFIRILLPYAEYLIEQIEAAVVYGALDADVLNIVNDYYYNKSKDK